MFQDSGQARADTPNDAFAFPKLASEFQDDFFWQKIDEYAAVTNEVFHSYGFQTKNSLSNISPAAAEKLLSFIRARTDESFAIDVTHGLAHSCMSVQVTPYVLSLIDWQDPLNCEIRKQFIPLKSTREPDHPLTRMDSLHEKHYSRAPGLVRRYYNRALFLPQTTCPVYCRYCTRSYAVGSNTNTVHKHRIDGTPSSWRQAFAYLQSTPEIEDVLLSGGDCYNLHPQILEKISESLLAIEHVRRIRIATKGLAVNPGRIFSDHKWTDAILRFVKKGRRLGKQVVIHTHINSAKEITWVTKKAMALLTAEGVIVRNQAVMLRGVNDTPSGMANLIGKLCAIDIQPYYTFQHDLVSGIDELRTSLARTIAIEHMVRGITAGFNTPQFVVDTPGGGGKRIVSAYDFYDKDTGISVFTAPAVKPGHQFMYFDPLHSLDADVVSQWSDPNWRNEICAKSLKIAANQALEKTLTN
jgi:lysine 2,3-aminomutase